MVVALSGAGTPQEATFTVTSGANGEQLVAWFKRQVRG